MAADEHEHLHSMILQLQQQNSEMMQQIQRLEKLILKQNQQVSTHLNAVLKLLQYAE